MQGVFPAPEGVTPDFDLSHNPLRITYLTALVLMLIFPSVTVPMRIYAKVFVIKAFKIADFLCILAFVSSGIKVDDSNLMYRR